MANPVNVNIKQTAYTAAINNLEACLTELEQAREQYEAQERKIDDFWTGAAADSAKQTIAKSIEQVEVSAKSVRENIEAIRKGQDKSSSIQSKIQNDLNESKNKISNLFG